VTEEADADFLARAEENYWPEFVDDARAVIGGMRQLGLKAVVAGMLEDPGPDSRSGDGVLGPRSIGDRNVSN
jgi:hypothetical protein